ncbi:MAG: riboflavin synthase [Nitriliruptoraceae bacterium]
MFTGIIEEIGRIRALSRLGDAARIEITAHEVISDVSVGDSIAVDGCCLTVTLAGDDYFAADLMAETLRASTLGARSAGEDVNLERALRADGRLGGHLVQGHVDGIGTIRGFEERPGTRFLDISVPVELGHLFVPKGSIAIDGVSLTIVDTDADHVRVGIIPHTAAATTLGLRTTGDNVNVEVDVIAKHVARLLAGGVDSPYRRLTDDSHAEQRL